MIYCKPTPLFSWKFLYRCSRLLGTSVCSLIASSLVLDVTVIRHTSIVKLVDYLSVSLCYLLATSMKTKGKLKGKCRCLKCSEMWKGVL